MIKGLIATALLLPGGICGHRNVVRQQAVVVQQPAVIVQQAPAFFYRVGSDIRYQSLAAQVKADVLSELRGGQQVQEAATEGAASISNAQALVNERCAACHDGGMPDRLNLTDLTSLSESQRLAVTRQVYSGKMPKDGTPFTDDEAAILVDWLLRKE